MAIFKCDLVKNRDRVNCVNHGFHVPFVATVTIPAGTVIALNDVIEIMDLSSRHPVVGLRVYTDDLDDATTMTWDVGFAKLTPGTGYGGTDASGVATDFDVASGTTYTSPTSDPNYYVAAGTFGRAAGYTSPTLAATVLADPAGIAGPVRVTATQTAATPTQTTASLVDRVIRFEFDVARATPTGTQTVDMGGY